MKKCELECFKDKAGKLVDNIDFCSIEYLSSGSNVSSKFNEQSSENNIHRFGMIHAMIWRFLPIGDSFVDIFMSRDSDKKIIQREVDSVNVWLNSNKIGHIMRGLNSMFE